MRLDEVAYSPDIVWITYGWDHFDPSKFERARVGDERFDYTNKPCGGLWACPVNSEWGWSHWCRAEEFRTDSLEKSFCFRLKPKAKIYVIDNAEDLGKISLHVSDGYTSRLVFNIDYGRLIESGYDGIYLTANGLFSCREGVDIVGNKFVPHADWATIPLIQGMSSWDVESICVFNPDVIIPIEKEAEPQGVKSITISESDIRTMVKESVSGVLKEYLDKNLMTPLYKYLKRTKKKYDLPAFEKLYGDYQIGKVQNITTRQAFQNPQVFKNGWVLHFTNAPQEILSNGFKGIKGDYLEVLWRTYHKGYVTGDEGYCFAYDANSELPSNCIDYGKYALMFRVSGLKVTNLGDLGEEQVIFNSKTANLRDCYVIKPEVRVDNSYNGAGDVDSDKTITGASVINPYTKKAVYKGKNISDAVKWVEANYRQYNTTSAFYNVDKIQNRFSRYQDYVRQITDWIRQNIDDECVIDSESNRGNIWTEIIFKGRVPYNKFMPFYAGIKADFKEVAELEVGSADYRRANIWISEKMGPTQSNFDITRKMMDELKCIIITYKP